eukprot:375492_1
MKNVLSMKAIVLFAVLFDLFCLCVAKSRTPPTPPSLQEWLIPITSRFPLRLRQIKDLPTDIADRIIREETTVKVEDLLSVLQRQIPQYFDPQDHLIKQNANSSKVIVLRTNGHQYSPLHRTTFGRIPLLQINQLIREIYASHFALHHCGDLVEIIALNDSRKDVLSGRIGWVFDNTQTEDNHTVYHVNVFTQNKPSKRTHDYYKQSFFPNRTNDNTRNYFKNFKFEARNLKKLEPVRALPFDQWDMIWYYWIADDLLSHIVAHVMRYYTTDGGLFRELFVEQDRVVKEYIGRLGALGGNMYKECGFFAMQNLIKRCGTDEDSRRTQNVTLETHIKMTSMLWAWHQALRTPSTVTAPGRF